MLLLTCDSQVCLRWQIHGAVLCRSGGQLYTRGATRAERVVIHPNERYDTKGSSFEMARSEDEMRWKKHVRWMPGCSKILKWKWDERWLSSLRTAARLLACLLAFDVYQRCRVCAKRLVPEDVQLRAEE